MNSTKNIGAKTILDKVKILGIFLNISDISYKGYFISTLSSIELESVV